MRAFKSFLACLCIFSAITSAFLMPTGRAQAASRTSSSESPAAAGVDITDLYRGGLVASLALTLPVTIKNTGTANDQYNVTIQWVDNHTGWTASLTDSNGQTVTQTSVIAPGASQTLQVKFRASNTAATGDYCKINVVVSSKNNPGVSKQAVRQAAVSAPFVQMFADYDSDTGRLIQITNSNLKFTRQIGPQTIFFSGLMTTVVSPYHYIHSWLYAIGKHANIEYEVMDVRSNRPSSVVQLTDNLDPVFDHTVAMAAAPNRVTGAVFIRTVSDVNDKQKQNVFFGRIDAGGLPMGQPKPITSNDQYGDSGDPLVPFFSGTNIRATANNRFIVTWLEQKDSTQNVYEAIYDTDGVLKSGPVKVTHLTDPSYCAASSLADGETGTQAVLTYVITNGTTSTLYGKVLDQNGSIANVNLNPAVAVNGSRIATVQFSNNNILVAWVEDSSFMPKYAVWNTNGTIVTSPTNLTPPDGLPANQIAVTYDLYSRGIITWGNTSFNRFYYALVDGNNGHLITPPMIQRVAALGFDFNFSAFSTALLEDPFRWEINIPVVRK